MSGPMTRRSLLAGTGYALAGSSILSQWLSVAGAAEAGQAGDAAICLSMIYLRERKQKFDARYFRSSHVPLLKRVYGDAIEHIEVRVADKPARGMPEQPVAAVFNMWISDLKAFGEKTAASSAEVQADLARATNGHPVLQYDRTIALIGSPRAAVSQDTICFSTYFQDKEGATFDAKYYLANVLPKMQDVYGPKVVQRMEVFQGSLGQGGARPAMVASTHLYINSMQDFMMAGRRAMSELGPEAPKYTNIVPFVTSLRVAAAG